MKELGKSSFIYLFENALEPYFCEKLIDFFESDESQCYPGQTYRGGGTNVNPTMGPPDDFKVTTDMTIGPDRSRKEKNFDKKLSHAVRECFDQLTDHFNEIGRKMPQMHLSYTLFQMQKSEIGKGIFKPHCDYSMNVMSERRFAVIVYLNDVHEGGETEFFNQKVKVKPTAGSILIFPTCWTHMHMGCTPESNDKYILTTFMVSDNIQAQINRQKGLDI